MPNFSDFFNMLNLFFSDFFNMLIFSSSDFFNMLDIFFRLLADIQFDRAIGYYVIQVMPFSNPMWFVKKKHVALLLLCQYVPPFTTMCHYVIQVKRPICQFFTSHQFEQIPLLTAAVHKKPQF